MTSAKKPRAACLIGWPAAHSRSPLIHHYWLRKLGIEGGYVIESVPPDQLQDFVFRLALRGFVGANVTIPHKERVLKLSKPDERAQAVGAANTLWFADGELCSTNTDVEGFLSNLDACAPGWDRAEEVLVLGAGGAARAVVFGLLERGIKHVHLANRTRARADALADQFGDEVVPVAWEAFADLLPRAKLLVNTTSLGMHGQDALDLDQVGPDLTAPGPRVGNDHERAEHTGHGHGSRTPGFMIPPGSRAALIRASTSTPAWPSSPAKNADFDRPTP